MQTYLLVRNVGKY